MIICPRVHARLSHESNKQQVCDQPTPSKPIVTFITQSTIRRDERYACHQRLCFTTRTTRHGGRLLSQIIPRFALITGFFDGISASCLPPTQLPHSAVGRRRPRSLCAFGLNSGWQRPSLRAFPIASWMRRERQGMEGETIELILPQATLGRA